MNCRTRKVAVGAMMAAVSAAATAAVPQRAGASEISIHPYGSLAAVQPITQGTAGVGSVAEPYTAWISYDLTAWPTTLSNLTDSTGSATSVSITFQDTTTGNPGYGNSFTLSSFPTNTGSYQLFVGGTNTNSSQGPLPVSFSGLSSWLSAQGASGYDIYVYFSSNTAGDSYYVSDGQGNTIYNYGDASGLSSYVQTTAATAAQAGTNIANYAVFYETANSVTLTATMLSASGGVSYAGFQIVPVPEPTTLAVIGAISTAGLLRRRRGPLPSRSAE